MVIIFWGEQVLGLVINDQGFVMLRLDSSFDKRVFQKVLHLLRRRDKRFQTFPSSLVNPFIAFG